MPLVEQKLLTLPAHMSSNYTILNQLRTGVYHVLMAQLFIRIKSTIISATIWNSLLALLWREVITGLYL